MADTFGPLLSELEGRLAKYLKRPNVGCACCTCRPHVVQALAVKLLQPESLAALDASKLSDEQSDALNVRRRL